MRLGSPSISAEGHASFPALGMVHGVVSDRAAQERSWPARSGTVRAGSGHTAAGRFSTGAETSTAPAHSLLTLGVHTIT